MVTNILQVFRLMYVMTKAYGVDVIWQIGKSKGPQNKPLSISKHVLYCGSIEKQQNFKSKGNGGFGSSYGHVKGIRIHNK